jgi:hypothetical protein
MRAHVLVLLLALTLTTKAAAQALPGQPVQPGQPNFPQPGQPPLTQPRLSRTPELTPAARVTSIRVSPDSAMVDAGACQQFTAEARNPSNGVESVPFTFALSNADAFQIGSDGLVCSKEGLPESARTFVTVGVAGSQVTATAALISRAAPPPPPPPSQGYVGGRGGTVFRQKSPGDRTLTAVPTGPFGGPDSLVRGLSAISVRPLEARVSWTPFINGTGYAIMRDGQIISGYTPIQGSTFTDNGVRPGFHGYSVIASLTMPDGTKTGTSPRALTTATVTVKGYPAHQLAWLNRPNGPGSGPESQHYYQSIGAIPNKDTFTKWLQANRFPDAPPNHAELHSVYFNSLDLEFGRDMHCVETSRDKYGSVHLYARANNLGLAEGEVIIGAACWVANHGPEPGTTDFPNPTRALAEAGAGTNPFAIVAMEWKQGEGVKFYAFGRNGQLVTAAALDSEGPKFVPNACLACHGGLFDSQNGRVEGGAFLPFDMSTFRLRPDDPRGGYLPYDFAKLNALVANTREGNDAITAFIAGLNQQGENYVPASWAGKEELYRQVIKPYCRTCHLAVRPDVIASAQQFQNLSGRLQALLCNSGTMPHAEVPFKRFWTSTNPYAPALLKASVGITCGE